MSTKSNYITNVAIIGAAGQVGRHIVAALLATGKHTVTALTREGSSSKTMPEGVKVARVPSYDDKAAVAEALRAAKAEALVITLSPQADQETQPNLIRAAAAAGVPFVVTNWWGGKLSDEQLGRDTLLGASRARAREVALDELGGATKLLAVACGFWYEFSLAGGINRFGFDFDNKKLLLFDDAKTQMHVSTWPQTGRAVAAALSLPVLPQSPGEEQQGQQQPTLSGLTASDEGAIYVSSFLLSQSDMFESVKRVTGTTDADWEVSRTTSARQYEEGRDRLFNKGDRAGFGQLLYGRVWFPGAGKFERTDNAALGLPEEDLDEATREAVRMAENHEVPY